MARPSRLARERYRRIVIRRFQQLQDDIDHMRHHIRNAPNGSFEEWEVDDLHRALNDATDALLNSIPLLPESRLRLSRRAVKRKEGAK